LKIRQSSFLISTTAFPPSELQEAGHAWLAHLRADHRSLKTFCDRERNLFAIVFPPSRRAGHQRASPDHHSHLDQLAVALSKRGPTPGTVGTYITHMIERLGQTAEIAKPVHPYVLRHTFATRAAARGVDPLMLADQLGHTTLTMVRPLHPAQRSAEG
jgi:integrase